MRLNELKKKHDNIALIIDDNADVRTLIRKALIGHCRTVEAMPSEKTLDVYQQYLPNIVFIDQDKVFEGKQDLIADIVAYDSDAFIVAISKHSTQEAILSARKRGAKGFISKPFNKDTVAKYIKLAHMKSPEHLSARSSKVNA